MRLHSIGWGLVALAVLFACSDDAAVPAGSDRGLDAGASSPGPSSGDGGDASTPGTSPDDAAAEASTPTDYGDVSDAMRWKLFELFGVHDQLEFTGAAFDGRYVYFTPVASGIVVRVDTHGTFDAADSWSMINIQALPGGSGGYLGAMYDGGHYVYLVPYGSGVAARLDTTADFKTATAWTFFDLAKVVPGAHGYWGGGFDGRYIYFAPFRHNEDLSLHGLTARYDTQADFSTASSWSFEDLTTIDPALAGFAGMAYDGHYMYYTPNSQNLGHLTVRYDPKLPFTGADSWSKFDLATVNPSLKGFEGGVFDGRYVYYVPFDYTHGSLLARYDTQAPFGTTTSWEKLDLLTVSPQAVGFGSGNFDGRYLILTPHGRDKGTALRFDTTRSLGDLGAWTTFDLLQLSPDGKGLSGCAFDGRYFYFAPDGFNAFARFDAKSPPSLLPFTPSFL